MTGGCRDTGQADVDLGGRLPVEEEVSRSPLKRADRRLACWPTIWDDSVMQGFERAGGELLDAAALAGHLVPAGSMFAFLAAHRAEVFPGR